MQEQITRLEMKIAFMEDTIDTLNSLVAEQQKVIDGMVSTIEKMGMKLSELAEMSSGFSIPQRKPPHY